MLESSAPDIRYSEGVALSTILWTNAFGLEKTDCRSTDSCVVYWYDGEIEVADLSVGQQVTSEAIHIPVQVIIVIITCSGHS